MKAYNFTKGLVFSGWLTVIGLFVIPVAGQLIDKTKTPNVADEGIAKSLVQQIGAGRGDLMTVDASAFIIARDPFRSIRRGRQLFQRKFIRAEGQGPGNPASGAGLTDSCASCHGRPRGSAGAGGSNVSRPDSRDSPHLFGIGLKEMLADEITADLRAIRAQAIAEAQSTGLAVTRQLMSKGINYGSIVANADGTLDTSKVEGVNPDLRVRPLTANGGSISIRELVVGALNAEMGLQAVDTDLIAASKGATVTTPSGMVLDGASDVFRASPALTADADPDGDGVKNEIPTSLVDHLEFYLLNYFKPAVYAQNESTTRGRQLFARIGCAQCHVPDLQINRDRRVADVETAYDPVNGVFNSLFATASLLTRSEDDHSGNPFLLLPGFQPFLVTNILTDLKRHDLGSNFYERNYDGTIRTQFLTAPLWGVGSSGPYGHDGRSINLMEVILRHGGEAQFARDAFAGLSLTKRSALLDFLNSLVLFPPDDTASTLNPGNRDALGFPQVAHGSIKLSALFNNPGDPE